MSHERIVQSSRNGQHAADGVSTPDPEVAPKAERRRFTAEQKLRILAEADACTQRGQIGAVLLKPGEQAVECPTLGANGARDATLGLPGSNEEVERHVEVGRRRQLGRRTHV
jgi:hypothetical protein